MRVVRQHGFAVAESPQAAARTFEGRVAAPAKRPTLVGAAHPAGGIRRSERRRQLARGHPVSIRNKRRFPARWREHSQRLRRPQIERQVSEHFTPAVSSCRIPYRDEHRGRAAHWAASSGMSR